MYSVRLAALLLATFSCIGCASTFRAFQEDPVRVNAVGPDVYTVSLAAERRTLIVRTTGDAAGRFCAEPPPEVSKDISENLKAAVNAKLSSKTGQSGEAAASLDDLYTATSVKLAERTVLLDIYRTGTYALCQYHLNGAIESSSLLTNFTDLTRQVLTAYGASKPGPADQKAVSPGSQSALPTKAARSDGNDR